MALGASTGDVLRLVTGKGLVLIVSGSVVGVVAALGISRLLTSLLFGVRPDDPLTLGGAAGLLVAVALLATYVPARAATRIDPMVALRYE
jgi:putative ABC transport system permease protein